MLKFTLLSDTQSELMQGGYRRVRNYKPSKRSWTPKHPGNGPVSNTTTTVGVIAGQESIATAFTLGGRYSLASNVVTQTMNIGIIA